jgi:hypothetical protein
MNLKVLKLRPWMFFKNRLPERYIPSNTIKEIKPIFNRNGYYRLNNLVWFENNNTAYEIINGKSSFNSHLKQECPRLLRDCEVKLVKDLIKNRLPIDSKLCTQYTIHCYFISRIETTRSMKILRNKALTSLTSTV